MNEEPPAEPGSRWAMPIALLVLAAYFVLGVFSGGVERGWFQGWRGRDAAKVWVGPGAGLLQMRRQDLPTLILPKVRRGLAVRLAL